MSHKIKPEDVTPELAKEILGWTSIVPRQARQKVADMVNAMIEAGLVSPPCWAVTRPGSQITWGPLSLEQAKRMVLHDEVIEHWKGQTE